MARPNQRGRVNELLNVSKHRILQLFTQLSYDGETTFDQIIEAFQGGEPKERHLLLGLVKEHNQHINKRIGIDYTQSTYQKYWAMEIRINQYVKQSLGSTKNLTTHPDGEHLQSTVMLNNGVRMEAVSRMLAHHQYQNHTTICESV